MRDWWVLSTRDIVRNGDRVFSNGKWKKIDNYDKNPFKSLIGKPVGESVAVCRPKNKLQAKGEEVLAKQIPRNGFFRKIQGEYVYKRIGFVRKGDFVLPEGHICGVSASGSVASVRDTDIVVACTVRDFFDIYNYKMESIEVDRSNEGDLIAKRISLAGE